VLEGLARWSMARPRLIAWACVWFVAWGLFFAWDIRFDFLPELAPAQATIQTDAPGLVAEQVEELVTRPIESRLLGAAGVGAVSSKSIEGLSIVTIRFAEGANPYRALQAVSENLPAVAATLPAGVSPPRISPLTPRGGEVMQLGFTSTRLDAMSLRDLVQWVVRPRLLSAPGVARVEVYGGATRQIVVLARPGDLSDSDLGFLDILNAVKRATSVAGAGFIDTPAQRVVIEPHGQALTTDDVGAGQIQTPGNAPQRIADVADVVEGPAPAFGDAMVMGKPGVLVSIAGQYGANTLEATRAVEHALEVLRPALAAQGVAVNILDRPAAFASAALHGIAIDLAIGAALIVVLLLIFLRDPRAVLISLTGILLSLLAAVMALKSLGLTLNAMTLGGLAIGLGVVVDDAVIDVENILARLRDAEARHASHREAVSAASLEVRGPVIYATWAVIVAVVPLLVLKGAQGALLAPMAEAVIAASLASLAVAAVITPSLCLIFLRHIRPAPNRGVLRRLKDAQGALTAKLLARPGWILLGAAVLTALALGGIGLTHSQFLPPVYDGRLVVEVSAPPNTSLEAMRDYGVRISADLKALPGVAAVSQRIGRDATGEDGWDTGHSVFEIGLDPHLTAGAQARLAERVRARLQLYPGLSPIVRSGFDESQAGAETAAPFQVLIFGQDLDALDAAATHIVTLLETLPGAREVRAQSDALAPVVRVDLNFQRLALFGLSASDVLDTIQAAFAGETVARIYHAGRIVDLAISAQQTLRQDPEGIGNLLVRSTSGISVPLKAVANVYLTDGHALIDHDGGFRRQVVTAAPTDAVGFAARARRAIADKIVLPTGAFIEFGGAAGAAAASRDDLILDYGFALFGVFALLAIAFDARTGAVILLSTLFSFVGGVGAVALMNGTFSVGAMVGFIALLGISMRSAILLICRIEDLVLLRGAAWSVETVVRATRNRSVPIVLTAALVALALAPIAIHAGAPGREIVGPMAVVVIGGLFTGTLAALVVLPALIVALWRPPGASRRRQQLDPPGATTEPG